jgi:DnaJ-domain-containing protein 1
VDNARSGDRKQVVGPSVAPRSFVRLAADGLQSGSDAAASYYELLGVDRQADSDALAEAYGRLRERYHPELNETDQLAREIVRLLDAAYATLIDPERRRGYDASLTNGLSGHEHALTIYADGMNGSHSYAAIATETTEPATSNGTPIGAGGAASTWRYCAADSWVGRWDGTPEPGQKQSL